MAAAKPILNTKQLENEVTKSAHVTQKSPKPACKNKRVQKAAEKQTTAPKISESRRLEGDAEFKF